MPEISYTRHHKHPNATLGDGQPTPPIYTSIQSAQQASHLFRIMEGERRIALAPQEDEKGIKGGDRGSVKSVSFEDWVMVHWNGRRDSEVGQRMLLHEVKQ